MCGQGSILLTLFLLKRSYSTQVSSIDTPAILPVKIYENADQDKAKIYAENKGKSGVYRMVNLQNGKSYVGSSINLTKRFSVYYNLNCLIKSSTLINRALFKYGYSGFSLEILEYCDKSKCIEREQYYLDLLQPPLPRQGEYNIFKIALALSLVINTLRILKLEIEPLNEKLCT